MREVHWGRHLQRFVAGLGGPAIQATSTSLGSVHFLSPLPPDHCRQVDDRVWGEGGAKRGQAPSGPFTHAPSGITGRRRVGKYDEGSWLA